MATVLNIVGRPFKGKILSVPKNVEVTYRRRWVTSVGQAIRGDSCCGLGSNRIRDEPARSLEALCDLNLAADQEQVDRVAGNSRGSVGESGKVREGIRIGIKTDEQYADKQQP
jgi:hypothetical protein